MSTSGCSYSFKMQPLYFIHSLCTEMQRLYFSLAEKTAMQDYWYRGKKQLSLEVNPFHTSADTGKNLVWDGF